jgi:hypothetical protein
VIDRNIRSFGGGIRRLMRKVGHDRPKNSTVPYRNKPVRLPSD